MHAMINRLREERARRWDEAKALLDTAEAAKRDLTAEEEQTWQRLNGEMDAIDARRQELEEAEQRTRAAESAFDAMLKQQPDQRRLPPGRNADDEGVRAFLRGEQRSFEVRPPRDGGPVSFRDLVKGTAAAGGNTVPTSFYGRLVEHMIEMSGVLRTEPTVLMTDSGEPIDIPVTTGHPTAVLVAEGAPIPEGDPAFGKRTLGSYKYGDLVQLSSELTTDTGVDLLGYLARAAGRAIGNAFGAHLVTGTGTNQPSGVAVVATTGKTGGAGVAGAFTADDLIDLFFSVIEPYRMSPSCSWMLRDASIAAARKLKDGQGQYIWQPGLVAGAPDTILGKPVRSDPNVAAIGTGAKSVLFGDFGAYFVRMVNGIRFERSDDYAFNTDMVTFRALLRGDGLLADQTGAIKAFVGGAA